MPLKLDRLKGNIPIGQVRDASGKVIGTVYPDQAYIRWDTDRCDRIEAETGSLEAAALAQAAAATANAAAATAITAAATANTAADDAQAATDENARFLKISNSNTTGLTITATDAGANVTVSFSAHVRHYADGTSVSVSAGSITALAYSTQYFFAYDQASLAGGAVTYNAYTSGPTAQPTAAGGTAPDRHFVGSVVTPAALGAPIAGAQPVGATFDFPIGGNWL